MVESFGSRAFREQGQGSVQGRMQWASDAALNFCRFPGLWYVKIIQLVLREAVVLGGAGGIEE